MSINFPNLVPNFQKINIVTKQKNNYYKIKVANLIQLTRPWIVMEENEKRD